MAASFGAKFVMENYLFMVTGKGRGLFNIFVGSLLFLTTAKATIASTIMGVALCLAGLFILYLSCCGRMTDVEIQRNLSVQTSEVRAGAKKVAYDNRETISNVAYDNRDVLAQVAYDNKDVIAQAAYDNRDVIAESMINNQTMLTEEYNKSQNTTPSKGY